MEEVSPEVGGVLERFLPLYQEDRERWPLWTYRRAPPAGSAPVASLRKAADPEDPINVADLAFLPEDAATTGDVPSHTWRGQVTSDGKLRWSWAGRWRWSAGWPIKQVLADLDRRARNSGLHGPIAGTGNREYRLRVSSTDGGEREIPLGFVPGARTMFLRDDNDSPVPVHVPLTIQARTAAVFASTAPVSIPGKPHEIDIPRAFMRQGLLDDHDWRELLDCIGQALLYDDPSALFRFFGRQAEATSGQAGHDERKGALGREEFNTLAGEVLRRAGLFPRLRGGTKDKLRGAFLRQLYEEATGVVREVKSYEPDGQMVSSLLNGEGERSAARKLALQLRFPWLTLPELQLTRCEVELRAVQAEELAERYPFLDENERAMLYRKGTSATSAKRAASILLRARLPSRLSYDGLASCDC